MRTCACPQQPARAGLSAGLPGAPPTAGRFDQAGRPRLGRKRPPGPLGERRGASHALGAAPGGPRGPLRPQTSRHQHFAEPPASASAAARPLHAQLLPLAPMPLLRRSAGVLAAPTLPQEHRIVSPAPTPGPTPDRRVRRPFWVSRAPCRVPAERWQLLPRRRSRVCMRALPAHAVTHAQLAHQQHSALQISSCVVCSSVHHHFNHFLLAPRRAGRTTRRRARARRSETALRARSATPVAAHHMEAHHMEAEADTWSHCCPPRRSVPGTPKDAVAVNQTIRCARTTQRNARSCMHTECVCSCCCSMLAC